MLVHSKSSHKRFCGEDFPEWGDDSRFPLRPHIVPNERSIGKRGEFLRMDMS